MECLETLSQFFPEASPRGERILDNGKVFNVDLYILPFLS